MRYPYSRFLKFLISRKADINSTLDSLGLPPITSEERGEHDTLSAPLPRSVERYYESPLNTVEGDKQGFLDWTEVHGISELWAIQPEFEEGVDPDDRASMQRACELFSEPQMRTSLAVLILKGFSKETISEIFEAKFGSPINAKTFGLAKRYFFDFSRMKKADWKNLLKNLPREQQSMMLLGLEPHSKEFVQFSVGKLPPLTFDEIMHDIMVSSYYKFKSCVDQPLADGKAMDWAKLAMTAGVNKAKFGRGDEVNFEEEMQLRFEFTAPEFPTITELSTPEQ